MKNMELDKVYEGDCLEVMETFPDKSIDCVITSPPYWQLRDYGWAGQWGMEKNFKEYLGHLWRFMDEVWRVLKDEGTAWVNLGDTYSTQYGSMGSGRWVDPKNPRATNVSQQQPKTGLPNKSLCLIPHRFAIGCSDRGWIIRNDVIWAKKNSMPESVIDRFSKKHEYIFFMTKKEKYYFDLESIKDRTTTKDLIIRDRDISKLNNTPGRSKMSGLKENNYDFKNPGSVSDFWDIPTKGTSDKHYASYNSILISKPILAGCPKGGIILDPFCGTGTTGCLAIELSRKFIGIEGKREYVDMANKNIGVVKSQSFIDLDELIIK